MEELMRMREAEREASLAREADVRMDAKTG